MSFCYSKFDSPSKHPYDEGEADDHDEKGEEVDKEEKSEMVDSVDDLRVNSMEAECYLIVLNYNIGICLEKHDRSALVELHLGMLDLPEEDCLWTGQSSRHHPGTEDHQSGINNLQLQSLVKA